MKVFYLFINSEVQNFKPKIDQFIKDDHEITKK